MSKLACLFILCMSVGSQAFAYVIQWDVDLQNNPGGRFSSTNVTVGFQRDQGFPVAHYEWDQDNYAHAEAAYSSSDDGITLFSDAIVNWTESLVMWSNANTNVSGTFMVVPESGETAGPLQVDLSTSFSGDYVDVAGESPLLQVDGEDVLSNSGSLALQTHTEYDFYAYLYSVATNWQHGDSSGRVDTAAVMDIGFGFSPLSSDPVNVNAPATALLLAAGLWLVTGRRRTLHTAVTGPMMRSATL